MIPSGHAEELIKQFESCVLKAYRCPNGIWTIGWGTTGSGIKPELQITQKTADAMLKAHMLEVGLFLSRMFGESLKQHEFDALTSFVYNIGEGAFRKSALCGLVKSLKMAEAASEFDKWVYASGNRLEGLVRRRKAEKTMFLGTPTATTSTKTV